MTPLIVLLALIVAAPVVLPDVSADAIELSDGSLLLGQVLRPSPRGGLVVLVRREWARKNLPGRLAGWERTEAALVRIARRERKARLIAWREGRGGDDLGAWLPQEIARLSTLKPPRSELMLATLGRDEVVSAARRPEETRRLLRLGWRAGLGKVETLSPQELRTALGFRGKLRDDDPAFVDALLPLYPESPETWRIRRAATEVALDPALRFVQFRELILAETPPTTNIMPRSTTELIDSPNGRAAFAAINGIDPADSVKARLAKIADDGRIGAVVSRLVFSVDSDRVEAESSFWVRSEGGAWAVVQSRSAGAALDGSDDADSGAAPPEETPIHSALLILESVAATPSSPAASRRRQALGSASQRAMARAVAGINRDLASYALTVVRPSR